MERGLALRGLTASDTRRSYRAFMRIYCSVIVVSLAFSGDPLLRIKVTPRGPCAITRSILNHVELIEFFISPHKERERDRHYQFRTR